MIKIYLDQIQSIFVDLVKYYKQNSSHGDEEYKSESDKYVKELEKSFSNKFSDDLISFLKWSSVMPIWQAPFLPFTKDGNNFFVWSRRSKSLTIRYSGKNLSEFDFLYGKFLNENLQDCIFQVFIDMDGSRTGIKESVFVKYGKVKDGYVFDVFENENEVKRIVIASNIIEFAKKYLVYLKTIPVKKKVYKKADKLLNEPLKLFKYAYKYNWDNGTDEMEYIVNDKRCDKATAILIYWLSQPYFYDEKVGKEMKMIPFVVEENLNKGFYIDSENKFDPEQNGMGNFIKEYKESKNKIRIVPEFMISIKV